MIRRVSFHHFRLNTFASFFPGCLQSTRTSRGGSSTFCPTTFTSRSTGLSTSPVRLTSANRIRRPRPRSSSSRWRRPRVLRSRRCRRSAEVRRSEVRSSWRRLPENQFLVRAVRYFYFKLFYKLRVVRFSKNESEEEVVNSILILVLIIPLIKQLNLLSTKARTSFEAFLPSSLRLHHFGALCCRSFLTHRDLSIHIERVLWVTF